MFSFRFALKTRTAQFLSYIYLVNAK